MEKLTCLIIENNEKDRENLIKLLNETNSVEIVAFTNNTKEALVLVNDLEPNLLFLEVKTDGTDAFRFLEKIKKQPTIVFLTNNDDSVKTFETNKLYYLKKPLKATDVQQLIATLQKTHQQIAKKMQGLLRKLKFED